MRNNQVYNMPSAQINFQRTEQFNSLFTSPQLLAKQTCVDVRQVSMTGIIVMN